MADLSLRDRCERRLASLKQVREPYEQEWREIAQHAQPSRSRFLHSETKGKFRRSNRAIYNSHGILAFRTLAGGMYSGLSSPSRPWFRLKPYDDALADDHEAKDWLAEVERRMYGFLNATNFYTTVRTGYAELGMFSTSGCVMMEHDVAGAVLHGLTAGEYWIGCGDKAEPDTLYRRAPMTVAQAMQSFGKANSKRVRDAYDRGDDEQIVNVHHAIEPNDERISGRLDYTGKPWRSLYWDCEDDTKDAYLRVSGMDEQPFWAPRWETCGGDAYGMGPGHDALPDLRELQLHTKRKTEATAQLVKPEKVAPASVMLTGEAGRVVAASEADAKAVMVPYEMPYQAIEAILNDMERLTGSVDRLAYADLFMAITNMAGVQPRNMEEIAARNEEKLTQLGPVIERVNTEQLGVAIDRTFGIMARRRMLPPAPDSLQGHAIKVDYVSILAQMQRMVGVGQTEKFLGFAQAAAGANPEVLDKIDFDEMIDDYADRVGAPPKILRGDAAVKQIRDSRAQQQQMANIAALMPAANQGTQAIKNVAGLGNGLTPA